MRRKCICKLTILLLLIVSGLCVNAQSAKAKKILYIENRGEDFDKLISKFKGSIIYVDVWATWCFPCRQELLKTEAKQFRNFAQENNIVIIYICCDKEQRSWKNFITSNNLYGHHFFQNEAIYRDFHSKFSQSQNRRGTIKQSFYLPRHFIIDKSGAMIDSAADEQGSKTVYKQLKRLLE